MKGAVAQLARTPWTRWIGFRYLRSQKHSRFLSFITLLSMLGVALGVTALIVVLSVMDGFEDQLEHRLMATDLHVLIEPTRSVPGFDRGLVPPASFPLEAVRAELARAGGVEGFWPIVSTEAVLRSGRKVTGVVLKGVDAGRMERLKAQLVETAEPQMLVQRDGGAPVRLPSVFVGQELAFEMGLIPGDLVSVISPTETEGPMSSVPRLKRYVIEGIFKSGIPEQELHTVFATEGGVRSFLKRTEGLTSWELSVSDFDHAARVADRLRPLLPGYRVKDWVEMNGHLFASLKLERFAMFVILAFIVVVASFNIVTTLTLMVLEKRREIAILKTMGAQDAQVAAIFLAEGLFIGGLGAVGGAALGLLICAALRRYEFIQLPDVYYDRTLPVSFVPGYYAGVIGVALVIVLLACLYPSWRAARLRPLDGIRFG